MQYGQKPQDLSFLPATFLTTGASEPPPANSDISLTSPAESALVGQITFDCAIIPPPPGEFANDHDSSEDGGSEDDFAAPQRTSFGQKAELQRSRSMDGGWPNNLSSEKLPRRSSFSTRGAGDGVHAPLDLKDGFKSQEEEIKGPMQMAGVQYPAALAEMPEVRL